MQLSINTKIHHCSIQQFQFIQNITAKKYTRDGKIYVMRSLDVYVKIWN